VLVSRVNALYGARANPQKRSGSSVSYLHVVVDKRDIAGAPNFAGQRKYSLNVQVDKKRLEGSINVYVFLGKDNEQHSDMGSSTDWVKTNSFVGVAGILSLGTPQMGAERAGASVEAHGEVPLTAALEAKVRSGELASMREDVVASYLRDNLRWRIAGVSRLWMGVSDWTYTDWF
jgi:tyrosinase